MTIQSILFFRNIFIFLFLAIILTNCQNQLPSYEDLSEKTYTLTDHDGNQFRFPLDTKSKAVVIGYIFTNCPDICPLTTNNMRLIQEEILKEKIDNVEFISISFDYETDKPEVLRKFAEIRNLNLENWKFLTGEKEVIKSLLKEVGVFAIPSDTVKLAEKDVTFYTHTDRISLMDENKIIRKNYSGSKLNIDEIIIDIKTLAD